jgi:hypothetical protein
MKNRTRHRLFNFAHGMALTTGLFICTATSAQTPYDMMDIGAQLTGKGISFGAFSTPLPLPPGEWLVVSKVASQIGLMGGRSDAPNTVPEITVGLKSTDAGNPVEVLMVTFTPDAVPIRWLSPGCSTTGTAGAPFKDDFETSPSSLTYGCAKGRYLVSGTKGLIDNLAHGTVAFNRDLYSGFVPHLSSISDSSLMLNMTFSMDKGRRTSYQMHVRAPSSILRGNAFDVAAQAWTHEVGLSIQAALQRKTIPIAAFPVSIGSKADAAEPLKKIFSAVELTLPGKVISGSIPLDENGTPLPLPPGQWKITSRGESEPSDASARKSSQVSLTLRNADPKASIGAAWISYNSTPFFASQASSKCENKTAPIVESYGSTSTSRIVTCGIANTYTKSFRQRVLNSRTTGTDWDKANLSGLIPHAEGLPEAHTWIELRAGSNDTRRLTYALYTAQPAAVSPNGKYLGAIRAWMEKGKDAMEAFLDGKPSSFTPYPELAD